MSASDFLRRTGERVLARTLRFAQTFGFLLLGIGVYVLVRSAAEGLPLAGQIAALAVVYVPLALLIYLLHKAPSERLAPFRRHGLSQPILFVTGLWLAAIGWFASFAFVLDERDIVHFATTKGAELSDSGQLVDFFVWQSWEQIPVLAVNDTLHWDVPLDYSGAAGVVVLAFKILILLPLVPVFVAAWRHRRPAATAKA